MIVSLYDRRQESAHKNSHRRETLPHIKGISSSQVKRAKTRSQGRHTQCSLSGFIPAASRSFLSISYTNSLTGSTKTMK